MVDILNARMAYGLDSQFGNSPQLEIMVDAGHWYQLLDRFANEWVWQKAGDDCWWACIDGWVRFLYHNGDDTNHNGFGGRLFTIFTKEGKMVTLGGPWSGRPSIFYRDTKGEVGPVADARVYTGISYGRWTDGTFGVYPTLDTIKEAMSYVPLEKGFQWIPFITKAESGKVIRFAAVKNHDTLATVLVEQH
jgi:hypothetical protein